MTMEITVVDRTGKNTMSCSMAVNSVVMDNVAVSAGGGEAWTNMAMTGVVMVDSRGMCWYNMLLGSTQL